MIEKTELDSKPLILAPAGSRASFLAALAAKADAVYCGMKSFSARMEAHNFTIKELIDLTRLAHEKGTKVYIALNSLLKPNEIDHAGRLIEQLNLLVKPDAIIFQDLAVLQLVRQINFSGELHLSTLANFGLSTALNLARENLGITRIVLPREFSIDEIKTLAWACPRGLDLEVFIHGALCYGVSGRCYWSSYFGGKSGLRGRCVQPCRRFYKQNKTAKRFFSCLDLSLDVLVKLLLSVPKVRVWKIEGRKKSPHYVFHTVTAYRMLRDHSTNSRMKKMAAELLKLALGREGTHYNFLSQRPQNPVAVNRETGSGLLMGKIKGGKQRPYLICKNELFPGDVLRSGYEDESWHGIYRVSKYIPRNGRLYLKFDSSKPQNRLPVFLVDRREKKIESLLEKLEEEIVNKSEPQRVSSVFKSKLYKSAKRKGKISELYVSRKPERKIPFDQAGLWLSFKTVDRLPKKSALKLYWWLSPVIWPEEEKEIIKLVDIALKNGYRNFVLNAPWQISFFKSPEKLNIWAGPFCNIANPSAINTLASLGFTGAIVSPELSGRDYMMLSEQSCLSLGIVVSGNWPLSVSRFISDDLKTDRLFTSPKGEGAWVKKYGSNYWVYPNWKLDLTSKKDALKAAGFSLLVHLNEQPPRHIKLKERPGLWNWDLNLL